MEWQVCVTVINCNLPPAVISCQGNLKWDYDLLLCIGGQTVRVVKIQETDIKDLCRKTVYFLIMAKLMCCVSWIAKSVKEDAPGIIVMILDFFFNLFLYLFLKFIKCLVLLRVKLLSDVITEGRVTMDSRKGVRKAENKERAIAVESLEGGRRQRNGGGDAGI